MTEATTLLDPSAAQPWAAAVLVASGLPQDDAATAASMLLRTSLRGIDTHGISLLPTYVGMIDKGEMNPRPVQHTTVHGATIFHEADHGLAQVTAVAALRSAIDLARTQPIVNCLVNHCGHLAALGTIALVAAEAGMFAFICQSTSPFMALPGWTAKAIGNNPLAYAAPLAGRAPLVFDMAASVVARGQLARAQREGKDLPPGWAIGPDGKPTTDAAVGLEGAVLPVGDYKGMGLAMLVQVLVSSTLGLSPALEAAAGVRLADMGAFMMVMNPALVSNGGFAADMDHWLATYLSAAGADARYPGQRAAESEAERKRTGIPVAPELLRRLTALAERTGQPVPLIA